MSAFQPASWRGVPFGVREAQVRLGRRCAVHEYPQRETVWVEDLGRSARRLRFIGFLMEHSALYAGGDVAAQRWNQQRMVEIAFEFIESGQPASPSAALDTREAVSALAAAADQAAVGDFIARADALLRGGASVVDQAAHTAARWTRQAQRLADDAGSLYRRVHDLPGTFG